MHTGLGLEVLLVAVVDQRVQPVDRLDPDVAAAPAVAAVRPAELDEFLAAERHRAGAAVAGTYVDFRLVEEFHLNDNDLLLWIWRLLYRKETTSASAGLANAIAGK